MLDSIPCRVSADLRIYQSNDDDGDTYQCVACLEDFDEDQADSDLVMKEDGSRDLICRSCREVCDYCGEWIDALKPLFGPPVKIRDWASSGRLSAPFHAECCAKQVCQDLLTLAGEMPLDVEPLTRTIVDAAHSVWAVQR